MVTEGNPHYIEYREVSKSFDRPILEKVSFYVDVGQTLAIIGGSGGGKSVTLSHMMGFLKPDPGRVIVGKVDMTDVRAGARRAMRKGVTMVCQSGGSFDT